MLDTWQIALVPVLAFLCEYVDSTLGMGYGTTLTPLFMLLGYSPMQIVPVILLSELATGISAAVCHHREGNVNFMPKSTTFSTVVAKLNTLGYVESFRRGIPIHLKVALLLGVCSVVGTVVAVFVAINVPKFWLKLYIGVIVLAMGVVILACMNKEFSFSWRKLSVLGVVASFNKGLSGGGYGPIVTCGQILSGVEGRSAVGITSLAEALTCLVGVLCYIMVTKGALDWRLAPYVIIGAMLSVPLSAKSVKVITARKLKLAIALLTIVLGAYTIYKTVNP